jgi:hypothetical protein
MLLFFSTYSILQNIFLLFSHCTVCENVPSPADTLYCVLVSLTIFTWVLVRYRKPTHMAVLVLLFSIRILTCTLVPLHTWSWSLALISSILKGLSHKMDLAFDDMYG